MKLIRRLEDTKSKNLFWLCNKLNSDLYVNKDSKIPLPIRKYVSRDPSSCMSSNFTGKMKI